MNLTMKLCYKKIILLETISFKWCLIYICVSTFVLVLAYVNWHTHLDEANINSNEYAESYNINIDNQNTTANAWIFLYVPSMLTGLFWTQRCIWHINFRFADNLFVITVFFHIIFLFFFKLVRKPFPQLS